MMYDDDIKADMGLQAECQPEVKILVSFPFGGIGIKGGSGYCMGIIIDPEDEIPSGFSSKTGSV